MNNIILTHSLRFLFLVIVQVLVLKQVAVGGDSFNYVHVIVYPLFIILLPIRTPDPLALLLGFLIGITVDIFYQSPGVHASAAVFAAFLRPLILNLLAPRGGYTLNASPNMEQFGFGWFATFSGIVLFGHLLFYFIMSVFTHVYWADIFFRTISSFFVSFFIILIYVRILNPRG